MENELKPCPFCGGEAKFGNSFWDGVFVYCTNCGCQTEYATDDKQCVAEKRAADLWNRRANDENDG